MTIPEADLAGSDGGLCGRESARLPLWSGQGGQGICQCDEPVGESRCDEAHAHGHGIAGCEEWSGAYTRSSVRTRSPQVVVNAICLPVASLIGAIERLAESTVEAATFRTTIWKSHGRGALMWLGPRRVSSLFRHVVSSP